MRNNTSSADHWSTRRGRFGVVATISVCHGFLQLNALLASGVFAFSPPCIVYVLFSAFGIYTKSGAQAKTLFPIQHQWVFCVVEGGPFFCSNRIWGRCSPCHGSAANHNSQWLNTSAVRGLSTWFEWGIFLVFWFYFLSYLNAGGVMSCGGCLLLLPGGCRLDSMFFWHAMDKKRNKILTKWYVWFEFKPKYEDQCCHTMKFCHISCLKKSASPTFILVWGVLLKWKATRLDCYSMEVLVSFQLITEVNRY